MIIGRSILSTGYFFLLSVFLVACSSGNGDSGITVSAGGEASAVSLSSGNNGSSDDNGGVGKDKNNNKETPVPTGPSFSELMAGGVEADASGIVVDSAVSGLRYRSGEHYGITDSTGKYGYVQGELVEFFIGDIRIGAAIEPTSRVTPYELASANNYMAMNIARFLQTLDNDADPENGIHINDAVHTLAENVTLDFSSSAWQEKPHPELELVDGKLVQKRSEVELLVFELSSATEAGARHLLSSSSAMGHLSTALHQVIIDLGQDAEALLNTSTCETDSQCKWTELSPIPSYCSHSQKLVYSELDADYPAFEALEAQRIYLIDVRENLKESVWGPDRTTGLCITQYRPTRAVCGESNHCEITTSW